MDSVHDHLNCVCFRLCSTFCFDLGARVHIGMQDNKIYDNLIQNLARNYMYLQVLCLFSSCSFL